jgi:hypothetical protein
MAPMARTARESERVHSHFEPRSLTEAISIKGC